ncbi:MAG: class I SAM-dependent methyltransferase, partial [Proteobacteria bacterium]|nr:class I SAM-dependent methyltransferase [Pseudomonadota bacterium]
MAKRALDAVTQQVKGLYERYPYPNSAQPRADVFPHLLLSYVVRQKHRDRLHILDAGCGTGAVILSVAEVCPEAQVLGVDLSKNALSIARNAAEQRGLLNIRFVEDDIHQLDDQIGPEGGFDLIYASGVVQLLAHPELALGRLATLLADDGVLVLWLYGRGREPIMRTARAIDLLHSDPDDFPQRIDLVRQLLPALINSPVTASPWHYGAETPDNEVVDRYLHPHDRTHTVAELFRLLHASRLEFIRWLEPREWGVEYLLHAGLAAEQLLLLDEWRRYEVLDLLFDHPQLALVLGHRGVERNTLPSSDEGLLNATIAWNPQATLKTTTYRWPGQAWLGEVGVQVRQGPPLVLGWPHAALVQAATQPMSGRELLALADVADCDALRDLL